MAFIAPLAGAALGGLLTGWAGWGLSVGWLVGSWLFGPKAESENKVFDPGAEEMPTFNQALRGSTIPVMFGTNRVSSQIVWQKNFTTIRHESKEGGGGGKFGGSGMGNKAGGAESTNVSYTYKWDLMYHLGITDTDYSLFGGWLGPERINDQAILAISNAGGSSGVSIFQSSGDRPNNADLDFESAFYHGAAPTGDTEASNWANFETEEGGAYRWPYTAYVGFKQLNLGGSARTPIITWEVGPGDVSITANQDTVAVASGTSAGYDPEVQGTIKGRDGKLYVIGSGAQSYSRTLNIYDPVLNTSTVYTETQMAVDATTLGYSSYWSGVYDTESDWWAYGTDILRTTDGGDYIVACLYATGIITRTYHAYLLYQIDENGALELMGGYGSDCDQLFMVNDGHSLHLTGQHLTTDHILMYKPASVSSSHYTLIVNLPPIANWLGAGIFETGQALDNRISFLQNELTTDNRPGQYALANNWNRANSTYLQEALNHCVSITVMPYVEIGVLPVWKCRVLFHYNYAKLKWLEDNPGSINGDTASDNIYTDYGATPGETYFAYFDLNLNGVSALDALPFNFEDQGLKVIPASDMFTDLSGTSVFLTDDGFIRDGVTSNKYASYLSHGRPQRLTSGLATGAFLLVLFKHGGETSPDHDFFDEDTYTKVRVCIWNPITKQFTIYATLESPLGSRTASAPNGWSSTVGFSFALQNINHYWDQTAEKLYASCWGQTGDGIDANDLALVEIGTLNISGGSDVTPPYVIYKILTSPVYGLGFSTDQIDTASYQLAVQYCESEDIKISVQYRREESALGAIDELLSLYGGFLTDTGGKVKFGLQEFTSAPVRTIDNDRLRIDQEGEAPVRVTKGARQDTYNRVKVNYFDRNLEYRQNFIELSDEVDMDINGVRAQEFPAKFVMSEATALKIATRALWGNLYARDIYQFKLGPKDADLEPGDVITLVDSYNVNLRGGKQVRIVEWQETAPLTFSVRAVDEIEYINASTTSAASASEASSNALFGPAAPPAYFQMYELPKEFQGADARLFVGYRQQSATMGARLFVSADGVSFTQTDDAKPYIISGILKEGLPNRDVGYVEENIEVYLMPDTRTVAFNPNTPTFCQTFALEDASANARALGTSALWINSEMVAYEGANLIAQNHYRFDKLYRGWGGTHIMAHNSGDTWWRHAGGVFTQALNIDKVGNIFYYKVQPYNFAGVGYNISSIDAKTYQIQGTYWRPQNPGALRTFVQSPGSYLTIQSEDLNFITKKKVVAGGSPVQIEWPDTSRESGYGALGNGYLTYGEFVTDTTSQQYRIQVYSSDGSTVVRCTTVSTLAFLYTVDNNSTDFNGWAGNFRVKVTPYNTYGDALRSRTKILELFE